MGKGVLKMTNALVRQEQPMAQAIEQVLISGDLAALTSTQRVDYYNRVCQSVGLNPLTRPFDYLKLNGKLVLYARRDAADQLRSIHGISLSKPHIEYVDDLVIVTIEASNRNGRTDTDLGAVSCKGLTGEAKANAMMKAITKAKRRVTLSIAGLGWLDETEVDSIPGAQRVDVDTDTGEIVENPFDAEADTKQAVLSEAQYKRLHALGKELYNGEWDEQRHKLVEAVSKGAVTSSKELMPNEADTLIKGIERRLNEVRALKAKQAAEVQSTGEPVAVAA